MSGVEASRDEAARLATAQAFTIGEDYEDAGRVIVHSLLNGWIGADWDLPALLALIKRADGVYWQDGPAGHDLAVIEYIDGRKLQYNFEVSRSSERVS